MNFCFSTQQNNMYNLKYEMFVKGTKYASSESEKKSFSKKSLSINQKALCISNEFLILLHHWLWKLWKTTCSIFNIFAFSYFQIRPKFPSIISTFTKQSIFKNHLCECVGEREREIFIKCELLSYSSRSVHLSIIHCIKGQSWPFHIRISSLVCLLLEHDGHSVT